MRCKGPSKHLLFHRQDDQLVKLQQCYCHLPLLLHIALHGVNFISFAHRKTQWQAYWLLYVTHRQGNYNFCNANP